MYFDLFLPFPVPQDDLANKKGKDKSKGKGKAAQQGHQANQNQNQNQSTKSCWEGLSESDRDGFARSTALAGHLGYSIVGCTISTQSSAHADPSPFRQGVPFPHLDPRTKHDEKKNGESSKSGGRGGGGLTMVQVTRYHLHMDDSKSHCLTGANASLLREYDILSVQPSSEKAFQLICTDLVLPGPNQVSIITLPLHERPYHFRLNRKQVRQAQRNGVMFEILYAAALAPSGSISRDLARRYRQNFMSNAKELVRITGGKNIILSSGPGGSEEAMRGPLDLVNLGTVLGMPANLAKDALSANPKRVLLNAQARRTFKGIMSTPKLIPPIAVEEGQSRAEGPVTGDKGSEQKRAPPEEVEQVGQGQSAKRVKIH